MWYVVVKLTLTVTAFRWDRISYELRLMIRTLFLGISASTPRSPPCLSSLLQSLPT